MTPADAARLAEIRDWQPIESAPENVPVRTKIHDHRGERNDQVLKRRGRLWWAPDDSIYVYYTPTHWMPLPPSPEIPHSDAGRSPEDSAQGEGT